VYDNLHFHLSALHVQGIGQRFALVLRLDAVAFHTDLLVVERCAHHTRARSVASKLLNISTQCPLDVICVFHTSAAVEQGALEVLNIHPHADSKYPCLMGTITVN
jgi:hypothetical protein